MNPEQLWETSICPDSRTLLVLSIQRQEIPVLEEHFTILMAKNEADSRRAWLESDDWSADLDI